MSTDSEIFVDTSGEAFQAKFEPEPSMERYEKYMIRFGHSDNLTALFEDGVGQQEAEDYVMGLIFVGAIILGFFVLWGIFLMIFMCIGHRVGYLSGAPFLRANDEYHKDVDLDEDHHDLHLDEANGSVANPSSRYNADYGIGAPVSIYPTGPTQTGEPEVVPLRNGDGWKSKPSIFRIIFIVSGVICIAFGLLLVTQGVTNLQTTINTVDARATDLNRLASSTVVVIRRGMRDLTATAQTLRTIIVNDMGDDADFCPADPELSLTDMGREVKETKDDVINVLESLGDFQDALLAQLEDAMDVIVDGTDEVLNESDQFELNGWESLIVVIPYTVFPSLMIVAALLALFDVSSNTYSCVINWFVLPVFVLMTVVAFVFAGSMSIAAGVNTDFCLPGGRTDSSPDSSLLSIMEARDFNRDSIEYKVANFYISQCANGVEDPWLEVREYEPQLGDTFRSMQKLIANLTDAEVIDELAVYCNRDFDILEPLLRSMIDTVEILTNSLIVLLDLSRCGRLIPLYTDTVYKAGCEYSARAVFWVFSCCLILGFFGMLMITLRSSMKMSVVESNYIGHFLRTESLSMRHQQDEGDDDPSEIREVDAQSTSRHSGVISTNSGAISTSKENQFQDHTSVTSFSYSVNEVGVARSGAD